MNQERKVELTSSGWLFNPERLFWIAGQINKERPLDAQVRVELYPTHYFMGWPLGPGRIDKDRILSWQKEHGSVPIERIHLPFHWSWSQAIENFFYNSLIPSSSRYEPGTGKNRVIAMGIGWMMTTVQNKFATRLAGEFGAGLNSHVHIIEEASKKDKLTEIKGNARYIWVENDLDYPRSKPEQLRAERDPKRAIRAVEKYGLEGVILGVDHDFLYGLDSLEHFEQNLTELKKHLRSIHLAGSEGYRTLIPVDNGEILDQKVNDVVDYVKQHFESTVNFCVDLNPFEMRYLTQAQQLDYIKELVRTLESS